MSSSVTDPSLLLSAKGESNNFMQSCDELTSDFFDQFLTFDTTSADHESPDYSILPTHFEDGPIDGGFSEAASSSFLEDQLGDSAGPQGESSTVLHNTALFDTELGSYLYAEETGRASISDPELLSLENITLDPPQILRHAQTSPSSPSSNVGPFFLKRNHTPESVAKTLRRTTGSIDKSPSRSPIKKSISSKMLRTHYSNNIQDFWEHNLIEDAVEQEFDYDDTLLLSPPAPQLSNISGSSVFPEEEGDILSCFTPKISLLQQPTTNLGYDTPITTPALEQHQTPRSNYQVASSSPFPITPRSNHASGSWSQVPPSGKFQPFSNSHAFSDIDGPVWWNHAATAPMAQPSPSGYHTNPQRATKSFVAMQLENDLSFSNNEIAFDHLNMSTGLMIQMPGVPHQRAYGMRGGGGSSPQQQGYFASQQTQPRHHHRGQQYLARTRQSQAFPHSHPLAYSSSHSQLSSHAHSHSRPSLRKTRSYTQRRHTPPPESDSESASPSSPSLQVRKRKTSRSKSSKSAGAGAVDFVNYTPSDSRKILTGVAPSGSSKTKARREKEALEKRRKLSQAAVRAVRAAGGDVDSLVEQGLLV